MADVPTHVGFIIDGNRRWAKARGLPTLEGHKKGYEQIKEVLFELFDQGVTYASAYIFSTENWKRSQEEVAYLMDLLVWVLKKDIKVFNEKNVRLRVAGSREGLSDKVKRAIDDAEAKTRDNTAGTVVLCLNYGGQLELVDAVRRIVDEGVVAEDIDEQLIASHLYVPDVPPCDLVVRTSGEQRLSNFMLWRVAYSELLFIDKNWPDMTKQDVTSILEEYARRSRRFGG